jgi:hypothetical protein
MAEPFQEQNKKSKRLLWLILIILFLFIIATIIYLVLNYYQSPQTQDDLNVNLNQTVSIPEVIPPGIDEYNQPSSSIVVDIEAENGDIIEEPVEEGGVLLVSTAFVERFGSYSNQSDYANLDDLEIFMVDDFKNWIPTYKKQLQLENPDFDTYYAINTEAISTQINSMDDDAGTANILIKTQRQEFKNSPSNSKIIYQEIILDLVKIDDQWKVKGAFWQ